MESKALEILKKHVDTTQDVVIDNESIISAMNEFAQLTCSKRMAEFYNENTGINIIGKKRLNQLTKHNISVKDDAIHNSQGQLIEAAVIMCYEVVGDSELNMMPSDWNRERCQNMLNQSYKERLAIAGAFIAAEIDRLNYTENQNNNHDLESNTTEA